MGGRSERNERSERVMALKKRRRKRRIAALLSCVVIVSLAAGDYYMLKPTVKSRETKDRVEITEVSKWKKYNIKIEYPKTQDEHLNKKIEKQVESARKDFLSDIKGKKKPKGKSYFDLNVSSRYTAYKKLAFVQTCSYQFTGGANYERKDDSLIYNTETHKYLNIYDLLESRKMLEDFSAIARQHVEAYYESHDMKYDSELVGTGTEPQEENYRNIYIKKDGMHVIFPPYQVGSRVDGEISITIPFEELVGVVQEKYLDETIVKEVKARKARERDLSPLRKKPVLALTFDDGPNNATTKKLVDTIAKYEGRATFFVLGSRVSDNAEALKYAYEKGNQIGSHTYSHLNLTKLGKGALRKEISRTDEEIEKITGMKPTVIRPPYGITNKKVKGAAGKTTILWNVDTRDWETRNKKAVAREIVKNARDGDIILMHDIYETTVDGCALAMKELYKKGYRFVTIDEMAELKGVKLNKNGTVLSFCKE